MAKKTRQPSASFLQKFWLPIILGVITLIGTIVTVVIPILTSRILTTTTPDPSGNFIYQVRVETRSSEPIPNVTVILEIGGGKAPLDGLSDSATGLVRIPIDQSYVGKPGRLTVRVTGYKTYTQAIDLTEGDLPKIIQLDPVP